MNKTNTQSDSTVVNVCWICRACHASGETHQDLLYALDGSPRCPTCASAQVVADGGGMLPWMAVHHRVEPQGCKVPVAVMSNESEFIQRGEIIAALNGISVSVDGVGMPVIFIEMPRDHVLQIQIWGDPPGDYPTQEIDLDLRDVARKEQGE